LTTLLSAKETATKKPNSIFDFNAMDIDGNIVNLSKYKGFVTYIVNVASK